MSYYAKIRMTPTPLTMMDAAEKIKARGLPHDDMWVRKKQQQFAFEMNLKLLNNVFFRNIIQVNRFF